MVTPPRIDGKIVEDGRIQSVLIDPRKFFVVVERHATQYLKSLRNPDSIELRENSKRAVDLRWRIDEPDGIIGMSEEDFLKR